MTNRGPGESGYGVLGEANYGSGELVWAALRTLDAPSTSAIIVQDGQRQEHEDASKPATALTEPARSAAVQEIIERESTFQPARNLIADLLAESLPDDGLEKVGNSELMAMVFISAETRQHRRVTIKDEAETLLRKQPILVLSRGRNLLEFIALRKTKIAVEQDEEILYDGHELPGAAQTHYVSDDGPIQQIARPEPVSDFDAPTTVAVRTPHAIQILKPAFRKPKSLSRHHRGAKTSEEASLEPSPLHKIKIGPGVDASGGNIAFNPWDDCQLAYVAADGQWTIWSLRSQVVTAICRSRLISNVLHNSSSDERGGCQITWVLDSNHVLVSYIDTLRVFDLIGRVAATWNLNMRAFGRRMVHMKRSTWDPATIVVTTPSHVLLLNVILNNTSSSIDCALAWRHHLSPTQPLYGIYFLSSHHADSQCVLISSSRSSLCLQLSLSGATTRKISLSDVTRTQWPSDSICGLTTLPIAGPTRGPSRPNEETQAKRDGTTIAQVFTLARYLEVQHTICYMPGRSRGYNSSLSHQSGWRFVSRSHRPKSRQYVSKSDDEDFLVQDVDASSERSDKPSSSAFRSSSPGVRKLALEAAFSIPHDRAYQLITLPEAAVDVELTDALEALGNLEKTLSPVASGHVPITTLDERLAQAFSISDVEQASAGASEVLQRLRPQNEKRTDPLSVAPLSSVTTIFLATVGIEGLSLSTIYGRLMSCWLRPYTSIAPARGRVSLEHLIRQVAAALFLSGIAARKVQAEIKTAGLEERPPLQDGLSKDTVHSQLPSPTPTPSTSDGVPLITLRQYTNVEATAQGLSRPVTKILDHWEPAIDPSDYDYTKKAAQVEDDDPSQVSQEEKQREQRRAESKRRRQESSQRKRAKLEQSTSGAESQSQAPRPPGSSPPSASRQTVDLSQPLAYPSVDGNSQALQLGPSSQAPTTASQIQPGKFGGKLPVRGRRKAGF